MHYLVDDLHSLEAAGWPEGEYWSTSTGLPYLLPEGLRMRSPEEFVDNDLYQDFGKAVLNAHADVRRYFTELEAGDPRLIDLAQCYSGQFYSTTLCVFYKALLLDRWLKHDTSADKAVIGSPKVARPAPGFFQFGRHDHLFWLSDYGWKNGFRSFLYHRSTNVTFLSLSILYLSSTKCGTS